MQPATPDLTMRFADIDAVTVDGYGTLLTLADPLPALQQALAAHGLERSRDAVQAAFLAEVAHYKPRSLRGGTPEGLAALRLECVEVFLTAVDADGTIAPEAFVDEFIAALVFEPLPGARETLEGLRSRGIALAMVSNWDCALPEHVERAGLGHLFTTVVASAVAGAEKPDPAIFRVALDRLGVDPARALHIGDEANDEQGAAAAGMRFAPAPIATAFEGWS
jgi:putative hydrolase of the HAD superfamily